MTTGSEVKARGRVMKLLQALLMLPFFLRQRRLAQTRKPLSEAEFVKQIVAQGGDEEAGVAVWRHLSDWIDADGFTPYPTDSLEKVFGIAEEERDEDLILTMLSGFGLEPRSNDWNSKFGSVDSPLRVAQYVAACRQRVHDVSET